MEPLSPDTLFEILLHLSGADLLTLCLTNKSLSSFCDENNDYFWQRKAEKDCPSALNKPSNLSWKRFYVTNSMKQIPLMYGIPDGRRITARGIPQSVSLGSIWINKTDTPEQILQRANKIFLAHYPDDAPSQLIMVGMDLMMTWNDPITNAYLVNFTLNFYDSVYYLVYYHDGGFKRIQTKEGVIRLVPMGRRS